MTTNWKERNKSVIEEFRSNAGKVASRSGADLLLLTTTGAKSGQKHVTPLMYTQDGKRFVIIASKGGAPTSPDWYHNLVANPKVTVEVGTDKFDSVAIVPSGKERDRLYAHQAKVYPFFADYEKKTTRKIPVVVLERKS